MPVGEQTRRGQDAEGNREIEGGPDLADVDRGEIDGDAALRELEPGVPDGALHALP